MSINKHNVNGFNEIIAFLSQPPTKVVFLLKRKKKFIQEWFNEYLDELPDIFVKLHHIDISKSIQQCPSWFNDFFVLIEKICLECKYYDKIINKCSQENKKKNCISAYNNIIILRCNKCVEESDICKIFIKKEINKICNGSKPSMPFKNTVIYSSNLNFSKYPINEILKRMNNETISSDNPEEWKQYSIGLLKKHRHNFPLLKVTFELGVSFSITKLEQLFNKILQKFTDKNYNLPLRQIETPALKVINLYYMFFWDLLNKTKLRNSPSLYEVIDKTSNYNEAGMILAFGLNHQKIDKNKIVDFVNEIKHPKFDSNYKNSNKHLFQHDSISRIQFQKFTNAITQISSTLGLTSVSEMDLPNNIRKKIDGFVKKKRFLRSPIDLKNNLEATINLNDVNKTKMLRYFDYAIHLRFICFIYSLINTKFRNRKSSVLDKKTLYELCSAIKKEDLPLKTIIEKNNLGKYSSIMDALDKLIKQHPEYKKNIRDSKYGVAQEIIRNSKTVNDCTWIEKLYDHT